MRLRHKLTLFFQQLTWIRQIPGSWKTSMLSTNSVVSNNSAHRWTPDVPMVVPEINPDHIEVIKAQQERLGTQRGFVAVKPNCSIQSYTPAIAAWQKFEPTQVLACTYQAISGAGKTLETNTRSSV